MTTAKTDIQTRDDIQLLVNTFYNQVRQNDHIGPIFNQIIKDWDAHLLLLYDFWETNLFFVQGYKGNPQKVHVGVDRATQNNITQAHFSTWLSIWLKTIDTLFEGQTASTAKTRAQKMSTHMFIKIFEARRQTQ